VLTLPHFISVVVLVGIVFQIFNSRSGLYGVMHFKLTGSYSMDLFSIPLNFRHFYLWSGVWQDFGWGSIIYLAALSGVDPSQHEAATVDGATRWQCTRYITIPSLVSTIVIMLILSIGSIMDAGFDQVFNLYNSAVYQTGDIIDTYVYRYGLGDMKYSLATAVGLFKNVIAFVLVVGTNLIARRISGEGIW
jgi:putative aldouronate transport system permease protein